MWPRDVEALYCEKYTSSGCQSAWDDVTAVQVSGLVMWITTLFSIIGILATLSFRMYSYCAEKEDFQQSSWWETLEQISSRKSRANYSFKDDVDHIEMAEFNSQNPDVDLEDDIGNLITFAIFFRSF